MRSWLRFLPIAAVTVLLAACGGEATQTGVRTDAQGHLAYGSLTFTPCALTGPGNTSVEAQCTTLSVPENHEAPNGRHIDLAIALVPARDAAQPDPVYMIAGGPGQSALESYPLLHGAFADVRRDRHVILVDARGTGKSHPLACTDAQGENAFTDLEDESLAAARAFAERCRDTLSRDSDLRFYATGDHVRDLDRVRQALGAERINLVGVSYGTRVAQQYAATYPQHTRALLLDSVVPNRLALGQEHARNLEDALQQLFQRCRAEPACLQNLGDPAQQLAQVRTRLQAGNLAPVGYRDPVDGQWREEVPRYGHLAGLLRLYAYQPQIAATLPLLLHEAAEGRYESLLAQSRMLMNDMGEAIMHGMQLSVMCTEDAADFQADTDPGAADTVLGTELLDYSKAQCEVWPKGQRAADFRQPLQDAHLPVLAISGQFDPVTPPRYGDEAIAQLPRGRHLVLPGQGHSVLAVGCMPKLFAQFIQDGDAAALDAACLQRLSVQPPFAGHYGWEP